MYDSSFGTFATSHCQIYLDKGSYIALYIMIHEKNSMEARVTGHNQS